MTSDGIKKNLLEKVAGLHSVPAGAYNIRENGKSSGRRSSENIIITNKEGSPGIVVEVKDKTVNQSVHIPVIITETGVAETVYNDFYIGESCDVLIVAGCGIHNGGDSASSHDGVHTLNIGAGSKVKYVEKHYAEGSGSKRTMNPVMKAYLAPFSVLEIETVQIGGVTESRRKTEIEAGEGAQVFITERLMTDGDEFVESVASVSLNGAGASSRINSRSVARGNSTQIFYPALTGNADCFGHVQCDSIIMDSAKVRSIPEICANDVNARLIHEAAIGKIAGDQILKLMTLGLSEEEAEQKILEGLMR